MVHPCTLRHAAPARTSRHSRRDPWYSLIPETGQYPVAIYRAAMLMRLADVLYSEPDVARLLLSRLACQLRKRLIFEVCYSLYRRCFFVSKIMLAAIG